MHKALDIVFAIIVLAAIFTLVRPRSKGPTLVKNITGGFAGVIRSATGGGSF